MPDMVTHLNFHGRKITTILQTISTLARRYRSYLVCAVVLGLLAASPVVARGGDNKDTVAPPPGVIFDAPLPDVPGKRLVVLALKFGPKSGQSSAGHQHPGSVYVYVTEGTARLGIVGQPVREVHAGESFFEPPGALHTVAESASPTDSVSVLAVMIVPEGAPLVTVEDQKGTR